MTSPLFLPNGYVENPAMSADADGTPFWREAPDDLALRWQVPVYRFAARRVARAGMTVLDVGCGTGHKLRQHLSKVVRRTVGMDQPSAIAHARSRFPDQEWIEGDLRDDAAWDRARRVEPDIVICADVIEHVADPLDLLDRLHGVLGSSGRLVLSTPDRARLDGARPLGPPHNERHIREWTIDELGELVRSRGFALREWHHVLPRSYEPSWIELKRVTWRALHGRTVPNRRSCAVLLLDADGDVRSRDDDEADVQ